MSEEDRGDEGTFDFDEMLKSFPQDDSDLEATWAALKERGKARAEKSEFDLERMIFGSSLEDQIADVAEDRIAKIERFGSGSADSLLREICDALADDIASKFDPEGKGSEYANELAASLLYLYPKLREATDKSFTMDEANALDFDELLSERCG